MEGCGRSGGTAWYDRGGEAGDNAVVGACPRRCRSPQTARVKRLRAVARAAGGSDDDYRATHQPGWARDAAARECAATNARRPRGVLRATDDPWQSGEAAGACRVLTLAPPRSRANTNPAETPRRCPAAPRRDRSVYEVVEAGCQPQRRLAHSATPRGRVAGGRWAEGRVLEAPHSAPRMCCWCGGGALPTGSCVSTRGGCGHAGGGLTAGKLERRSAVKNAPHAEHPTSPLFSCAPQGRRGVCGQGKGGRRPARNRRMTVSVHAYVPVPPALSPTPLCRQKRPEWALSWPFLFVVASLACGGVNRSVKASSKEGRTGTREAE